MAIQFCDDCGDTLPVSSDDIVPCDCCGKTNKNKIISQTTTSTTDRFPSELRIKLKSNTQILTAQDKAGAQQKINRPCPKCGAEEMTFTTAQLRSADEGTTVFYWCPDCGNRFSENN